ncbi:MAG: RecX family transcriptional regulator [Candidatus Saccharibacteria bacterium]|nr:RecX family transcriptional regulator [Candidatus Saccharibacteria bacterium]
MKITDIKQQVKRNDRYSVYVDEKYACSFSDSELLNLGLRVGQEVTESEVQDLKRSSQQDKAYMRTLDLLSRRPRSEWELRDYLKRKDNDQETIDIILNKLSNLGYVDDMDFARRWIESRRLLKSTSKRKLRQELQQKRINSSIIDEVLSEDETDEREVLRQIVDKKRDRYPDKLKLMQYLARQGFNYDDIKTVLEEMS